MNQEAQKPFVDLEKLFQEKNPKLAKRLPKFILNWLRRVIHENDLNKFMADNGHMDGINFCKQVISDWGVKADVTGAENIPDTGGCIIVANHPLGGFDAMTFVSKISEKRTDIKFIVNDILLYVKPMGSLFAGVNKHGANARESLHEVDKLFSSEQALFLFPAGLVSRKNHGIIKDLEWKKTFVTRAVKYHKPVIPVHISGELTPFFYRLSRIRRFFGIKANIEMLYLVDEMYRQHGKHINITIGKPISYTTFDKSKTQDEWAAWMREQVYELGKK